MPASHRDPPSRADPMTQPDRSATPPAPLVLRAQRRGDRGEKIVRYLMVPPNHPVRLGREARTTRAGPAIDQQATVTFGEQVGLDLLRAAADADGAYGSDLVFPYDNHISNFHATLTWDGVRLHVQRRPQARNPVFRLDRNDPGIAQAADEFDVGFDEQFRIGNTVFTCLERVPADGEALPKTDFIDPAPPFDELSSLPNLMRSAPDQQRLQAELLDVLLRGVRRADVAAVVALTPIGQDAPAVAVLAERWRDEPMRPFRPSPLLVRRAVQEYENAQFTWSPGYWLTEYAPKGEPPIPAEAGWSVCVPMLGSAAEALYLAGRGGGRGYAQVLIGAMEFARLAGDIYTGLRELRLLQQREAFLTQMLTPVLRHAVAGQCLEEVTQPRQLPVTVLFCDIRGSVRAAELGKDDLMTSWETLSEALDVMTDAIVEQDGVIGDFQGDAAMGFWGWPFPQEDQVERAAKAALTIRRKFVGYAQKRRHPLSGFVCGIGVAHGPAIAGKLGARDQAKIGVFGPVVNRAARLESATKRIGVPIVVDQAVSGHLWQSKARPWSRLRTIGPVCAQGIEAPIWVSELLPPEGDPGPNLSEANRRIYEAALNKFAARDWTGFRKMVASFPPDGPVKFVSDFIARCPDGCPPENWNGGVPV
jgi:adenylate cyclase